MSTALSAHINSSLSETHNIIASGYERTGRGWMRSGTEGEKGEGIEGGGKCEADLQLMTAYMCALSPVFRLFAFTLAFVPYSVDRVT